MLQVLTKYEVYQLNGICGGPILILIIFIIPPVTNAFNQYPINSISMCRRYKAFTFHFATDSIRKLFF